MSQVTSYYEVPVLGIEHNNSIISETATAPTAIPDRSCGGRTHLFIHSFVITPYTLIWYVCMYVRVRRSV